MKVIMKPFTLEEYRNNPKRKIVTRDGRNAKIICTNFLSNKNVIAEIEKDGYSLSYDENGRNNNFSTPCDLFFAPEKHERWINLYKWDNSTRYYVSKPFDSEEEAMEFSRKDDNYLKTLKIEWEE